MDKEKFQMQVIDYLSGLMDEKEQEIFEDFLEGHPGLKEQFQEVSWAWNQVDEMETPEPSTNMDVRFYDMLSGQVESNNKSTDSRGSRFQTFLENLWRPQLAYGILLLVLGLGIGSYLGSDKGAKSIEKTVVSNSETEVREKLVLTLLEQPSANKRLQGVSEATKLNSATEQMVKALFTTLNNDPNINVRLVAIESLARYVENPEVRMGFIQSISKQESPLVQIALADLMVKLQEKSSVDPMRQLLEQPDIDTTVKQKIEESINHII